MPNIRKMMMAAAGASGGEVRKMWAWGKNAVGQLGDNTTTNRSSPVLVAGGSESWTVCSAGHDCGLGIRSDGTLWTWGRASYGRLGDGQTSSNKSCPVQVGSLTDWNTDDVKKSSLYYGGFVIKDDGLLWGWGNNSKGQIGVGNTTANSSPVHVGSFTDWAHIVAGGGSSLAIKTNNTLWTWGYGDQGALGHGNRTYYSSPVQVGALTTWAFATMARHVLAVKTDGTLWAWGRAQAGALGLGDTTNRSSPVQVGSLTNWATTAAGTDWSVAIKTDGTLWAWGNNSAGQLGQGNTTDYSSPVQIGSLTDWSKVYTGPNARAWVALKTDNTAWSCGYNKYGILGVGNTTNRSSPVQIGSETTWLQIDIKSGTPNSIKST